MGRHGMTASWTYPETPAAFIPHGQ
jgi:hypothetical protein